MLHLFFFFFYVILYHFFIPCGIIVLREFHVHVRMVVSTFNPFRYSYTYDFNWRIVSNNDLVYNRLHISCFLGPCIFMYHISLYVKEPFIIIKSSSSHSSISRSPLSLMLSSPNVPTVLSSVFLLFKFPFSFYVAFK